MFGEVVRAHRRRLGITQEELAERAGLNVRGIRKIETGQVLAPRPSTLRLLADVFGLSGADRDQFCAAASAPQPPPERATVQAGRPTPGQLPVDVAGFIGRTDQLSALDRLLDQAARQPATVVISVIAGTAGVGKTALAVHWAHRVRNRFPDGQLYVNLRGFDTSQSVMHPGEVVRGFIDALGVPPERIPADLHAQAALYRTLLADKRMLIVLDNARDAAQVSPLLPGASGSFVLVTSRNQLTSLIATQGARPLTLDLLTADEARELLVRRLGKARVFAEPDAAAEIITRCARLPLALAIVAARAVARPEFPLGAMAGELCRAGDAGASLDTFADADTVINVRAVFSWSYRTLSDEAARLFRLLGLHPGQDIAAPAAASIVAVPVDRVQLLLVELARAHVISEHVPGRYMFHDLLRAYAAELTRIHRSEHDGHAALRRMLDYYLHTAHRGDQALDAYARDKATPPSAAPGVVAENFADAGQAMSWFTAERSTLLAVIHLAGSSGFDVHAWRLAFAVWEYFDMQGHWHDWVSAQHAALAAAGRLGDRSAQAHAHRGLARAYGRLGRYADTHTHLETALNVFEELADTVGQARTHMNLALVCGRQGRQEEALRHSREALRMFRAADHAIGQANALNAVGWHSALLGDFDQALTCCQQSLSLNEELGDSNGQIAAWDSLGYAHHHLGHHERSLACYQQALELCRARGSRYYEGDILVHLGEAHQATGEAAAARDAWERALAIFDEIGHADADGVKARLHNLAQTKPPGRASPGAVA